MQNMNIRLVREEDIKNVFDLSNDDLVRRNSTNNNKIEWQNHIEWFKKRIEKLNEEPFYIVEDKNNNFVGQIRIDKKNNENIVSISIIKEYRGQGLASIIIKEAIKKSKLNNIVAYVYKNNVSSLKSFEKAGFKKDAVINDIIKYNFMVE